MKAIIVTQEEPCYIPVFLAKVLAEYEKVIAVIVLPGIPRGFTPFSYIKRLYDVFGLKEFVAYGALFLHHKLLDLLSRWRRLGRFYSVTSAARRNSIPVYRLNDINAAASLNLLQALAPEIIISVAAPQIFSLKLIHLAQHTINIHASLLPRYRGMMPSFWVLAKGEKVTGVTVHYVNERVDTGSIILQQTIDISPEDTLHRLQTKVARIGAVALLQALEKAEKGTGAAIVPPGEESYYSFPTKEAAREFRASGRRFI